MLRRFLAAFFELLKQSNIPRPPRQATDTTNQQQIEDQRPMPVGSKRPNRGVIAEDVSTSDGNDCSRGPSPAAAGAKEGEAPLKSARSEGGTCATAAPVLPTRASSERTA